MRMRVPVLCVVPVRVRRAGRRHLDGERHRYTRVIGLVDAFAGWTWTRGVLEERRVRKTKPVRHSTEKQKEKEKDNARLSSLILYRRRARSEKVVSKKLSSQGT